MVRNIIAGLGGASRLVDERRQRWLVLAPVPAIVVGAVVAHDDGVSFAAFVGNVVAVVIGAVCVLSGARRAVGERTQVIALAALAALAATLLGPGVDDVHRWIRLGPLLLNVSMAVVPLVLLAIDRSLFGAVVVVIAQLLHVAQPDAGQATVLAVGTVLLMGRRGRDLVAVVAVIVVAVLAVVAWTRADPVAPVAHVEGILGLIAARGAGAVVVGVIATAILFAPLVGTSRSAIAATSMLLTTFAVTVVGAFPVPVFGAGAAPVLGWYGLLVLSAARRGEGDEGACSI